jgi:hypothetical protein
MRTVKNILLALGLMAVAVVGIAMSRPGHAQEPAPSIGVTSSVAAAGASGVFQIYARDIPGDGLGSWTVDVSYDENTVSIPQCTPTIQVSTCDPRFGPGMIRTSGTAPRGRTGDFVLAQLLYDCAKREGSTVLNVMLRDVRDASRGRATLTVDDVDGAIVCQQDVASGARTLGAVAGADLRAGASGAGAVGASGDPLPGLPAAGSAAPEQGGSLLPAALVAVVGSLAVAVLAGVAARRQTMS